MIVVDTNVLVAALIQRGIVRELVLRHPGAFMTSEACIAEIWEHRREWNRRGLPDGVLKESVDALTLDLISVVPRSAYAHAEAKATSLTPDPDDAPIVALALAVDNEGVWTFNTKDFSDPRLASRTRVLTTSDVQRILSGR